MKILHALFLTVFPAALAAPVFAQGAADEYYSAEEMRAAREALRVSVGGQSNTMLFFDRLEYQSNEGDSVLLWDAQCWTGGDINKLWLKTEGEYLSDAGTFEEADLQALYSRAVSPYFDLQLGYRFDAQPDSKKHFAVFGVQGLAPYWFELDAAVFVSDDGDVTAGLEAEYEFFLTQRLIVQPRVELEFALQDVPELGIGSGLSTAAAGLRVRYEFRREFAPYVGVSWRRAIGSTADFVRADGDDIEALFFVAGLRFWF